MSAPAGYSSGLEAARAQRPVYRAATMTRTVSDAEYEGVLKAGASNQYGSLVSR